jgi:hypothetical protein
LERTEEFLKTFHTNAFTELRWRSIKTLVRLSLSYRGATLVIYTDDITGLLGNQGVSDNPIIILPQTIYKTEQILNEDAENLASIRI